jgi:cyclopropane fatty-acyl-phospholipid synthase-like methyltransferase
MARYKADVINSLVVDLAVTSVIEFGCGDGNQLRLAQYPKYIGLDVSRSAIQRCERHFADDRTKSFFLYDPQAFVDRGQVFTADAALSLDVIFHLVEDSVFDTYMRHLFNSAERLVIVYSSNVEKGTNSGHERHRRFTDWTDQHLDGWTLSRHIPNEHYSWDDSNGSASEFFVYQRARALR